MKTTVVLAVICICLGTGAKAAHPIKTSLNFSIDTLHQSDPNIKKVFKCWEGYLKANPDSLFNNSYWNEKDKQRYTSYDLLKSEGFLSPGLYAFKLQNTVLSITNIGEKYIIRSMFYKVNNENGNANIMAITNTIAQVDEQGTVKLSNWLHHHIRDWHHKKVGMIDYYYYPDYPFNIFQAEKANKFISFLKDKFDIKADRVEYYIAQNCDEIMRLKGFDYVITMGENALNLCGFFDRFNNIIYSNAVKGEYYEHELTRLLNNFYPNSHHLFLNGLSDYFIEDNMKLGLPINEHFKRIDNYLQKNPHIDLNNLTSFYSLDDITPPLYFIGLVLTQKTLEKGGIGLLKKAMQSGYKDEELYAFMEKELGIKPKEINKTFRKLIHQYATNGFQKIKLE